MNQMASVYITNVTARSKPEKILTCAPWARQSSADANLNKGEVYHITAATFSPGTLSPTDELLCTRIETCARIGFLYRPTDRYVGSEMGNPGTRYTQMMMDRDSETHGGDMEFRRR